MRHRKLISKYVTYHFAGDKQYLYIYLYTCIPVACGRKQKSSNGSRYQSIGFLYVINVVYCQLTYGGSRLERNRPHGPHHRRVKDKWVCIILQASHTATLCTVPRL